MNSNKVIGILGGMGPYATLYFFQNILQLTNAEKDWDHVHVVIDNNITIPSRTRAIVFKEKSPYEGMLESCKKLQKYPVDIIVVPCNSAYYWIPNIQKVINTPIVSIIGVTTEALFNKHNCKHIAVLGGIVTYEKELYKSEINEYGAEHIKISSDLQRKSMNIIEKVKLSKKDNNSRLSKDFKNLVNDVTMNSNIDGIILGCTEFSIFKETDINIPIVDSSTELAKYTINYAKN